jgi:hypothetical protein
LEYFRATSTPFPENQVNRYLIPGGIRGHSRKTMETKAECLWMPIAVIFRSMVASMAIPKGTCPGLL